MSAPTIEEAQEAELAARGAAAALSGRLLVVGRGDVCSPAPDATLAKVSRGATGARYRHFANKMTMSISSAQESMWRCE